MLPARWTPFSTGRYLSLACVLAACLVSAHGSVAAGRTAREMLRACEILQRGMHIEGQTVYLPPGGDVHQCWGFMSAVLEYAALGDRDGKPLLGACARPDVTTTQVIRLFIGYANAHPDKLDLSAAALAYNAMADAFPCK